MPEETSTPPTTPEAPAAPSTETPPPDESGNLTPEPDVEDGSPVNDMFPRQYVEGLRTENGSWRTKFRELEGRFATAKTPEQIEEITAEIKAENSRLTRELLVTKVAQKHDLPEDLAALLKGDDEKALAAHAKILAKYASNGADPDVTGGLDPSDTDTDGLDPRKLAERAKRRR